MSTSDFTEMERQLLVLQANATKLRKALQHWRVLDAEYEGLKEEILAGKTYPTTKDLEAYGREIGGSVADQKELRDLVGDGRGIRRTSSQITEVLSRRIDYVQQNTRTLERQLASVERDIQVLLDDGSQEAEPDSKLPLTEIVEELDEEGNVIASHLSNPGDAAPQLLKSLEKAGLKADDLEGSKVEGQGTLSEKQADRVNAEQSSSVRSESKTEEAPMKADDDSSRPTRESSSKKRVSFTKETKEVSNTKTTKTTNPPTKSKDTHIRPTWWNSPNTLTDGEMAESDDPVIPIDESLEDAQLRRQMLEYGLSEVGAVVAELELDDGDEDDDYDDEDEHSDGDKGEWYDESGDDESDEDEHGRTKKSVLDDNYRAEMQALMRKLTKGGPSPMQLRDQSNLPIDQPIAIDGVGSKKTRRSRSSSGKGVRFAEELDVAEVGSGWITKQPLKDPICDAIVERNPSDDRTASSLTKPSKKLTRFKSARTTTKAPATTLSQPIQPSKSPLSATLVERVLSTPTKPPVDPDSDTEDPVLERQNIATRYYAQRSRMIQQQGGFSAERIEDRLEAGDESQEVRVPLDHDASQPEVAKRSRFMAARLRTTNP